MPAGRVSLLATIQEYSYTELQGLTCSDISVKKLRSLCERTWGSSPCLWQIRIAFMILKGKTDVICVARTGAGKSLTFYLPLLVRKNGIIIVVVPLNALASEMAATLATFGINAIALTASNSNRKSFKVSLDLMVQNLYRRLTFFKDIEDLKYRVVVTNPETLLDKKGRLLRLLKEPVFFRHVICVIIDEAHCVVNWGTFRPEYKEMGLLRFILPSTIPLYLVSATLPPATLHTIRRLLHIRDDACEVIMSNDRPNVSIMVRKITHGLNTYWDLAFLVPQGWKPGDAKPMLFLVMFDSIRILQEALEFLRRRLAKEHRRMILPFHSEMSEEHRVETIKLMKTGSILGVCASEGFGLVSRKYL